MPQAAPVLGTIFVGVIGKVAASKIIAAIFVNVLLGALSRALVKKPRVEIPPINVSVRNVIENRRIVLGSPRCGGVFVYYGTTGLDANTLWYVVAYAGHQCAASRDHWLDTRRVANSAIGGGAAEGGAVTTGPFANVLSIFKHLGTSTQIVDADLDAASSAWTADHRLKGICYSVIKMTRDPDKYPQGAPQNVTALIDGALVYDPRKDSTNGGSGSHRREDPRTWEFTNGGVPLGRNPALQWRWYVAGGSVHNDQATRLVKYGLNDDLRIDDPFVIAAANECDETLSGGNAPPSGSQARYRCDIEFSTGETRREIIEDILATMAGSHVYVHGKHRVYAGAYDSPTHSFTEKDLYGALEVQDTLGHDERFNQVAAVYRDAAQDYIEQTTIFRTDSGFETRDGGRPLPTEIDLRGVTDIYQAQRLAEIKLRKSDMQRTVTLVGALNLLKVAPYETLTLTYARYGWTNRVFRCLERDFQFGEEAGKVVLTCQREDAGVYTDLETADYTTGTSSTDTFTNDTPDPPSNVRTNGLANAIVVQWDRPAIMFPGTTFDARMSTAAAMTSPTTILDRGADLQTIVPRTTTADAYFQVRSVRNGQPSAWVPSPNGVLGKASSASAALSATVSPGSASSSGGAANQTTNSVTVTPSGGTSPYTYAWTWASGGGSITIDSNTAATTTFSTTGLTSGQTRSGIARCTVSDNASATYTIDVDVSITRPAPTITTPAVVLSGNSLTPTDASCAFRVDADGHWYSSVTTGSPATDRGLWCNPPEYAADFEIQVARTGGTETLMTSGPALGSYHALSSDREWRLTDTGAGGGVKSIVFTIDIRLIAGPGTPVTTTNNSIEVQEEA